MIKTEIVLSLIALVIFITPCYANTIDDIGFDYQYSRYLPNVVESDSHYHRVKRTTLRAGKLFSRHFKLDGELVFSQHRSTPKISNEISYRARELGVNIVGKYQLGNRTWLFNPYIGWLFGMAWLIDRKDQPNWAESGTLGTWGPVIGINIPINPKTDIKAEYRITHTSDPFGGDSGRNFEGVVLGMTYHF